MSDMVNEAIKHMGRRLDGYRLEKDEPDALLFVKADARLIVQVVINLLDNAIKYAPAGSKIAIGLSEKGENVIVRIADEGLGIPDDQKAQVFDLFFTGGNSTGDSRRGLGIGLSLCQSIVRAHGGAITVSDNAPHGAAFEFSLPKDEVTMRE